MARSLLTDYSKARIWIDSINYYHDISINPGLQLCQMLGKYHICLEFSLKAIRPG